MNRDEAINGGVKQYFGTTELKKRLKRGLNRFKRAERDVRK